VKKINKIIGYNKAQRVKMIYTSTSSILTSHAEAAKIGLAGNNITITKPIIARKIITVAYIYEKAFPQGLTHIVPIPEIANTIVKI
jgi:hypothetical protein